ncbi:MAG TPA: SET domain-containing protein-lysine N-methyltransferase [Chitinophagaceae bacterium]|jgi:hypothetical protein|nr:SET domain-containing protein-lysine N-methyltransferase [Chitinophagaceae bacterium]
MKKFSYLAEGIYADRSGDRGLGVFTRYELEANVIIEVAPVIVMTGTERKLIDQTLLHDYIFEWGPKQEECCMALGLVPLYNHSYTSNCEYEMNFRRRTIRIKTVRPIAKGEELFINYNGEWDNAKPVWFDVR